MMNTVKILKDGVEFFIRGLQREAETLVEMEEFGIAIWWHPFYLVIPFDYKYWDMPSMGPRLPNRGVYVYWDSFKKSLSNKKEK